MKYSLQILKVSFKYPILDNFKKIVAMPKKSGCSTVSTNCKLPLVILSFPWLILYWSVSWLAVPINYYRFYSVNLSLFLS